MLAEEDFGGSVEGGVEFFGAFGGDVKGDLGIFLPHIAAHMHESNFTDELITSLQQAVMDGDVAALQQAIELVFEEGVQAHSALITNLLHTAVEWDRVEVASFLIEKGAEVDGRDEHGDTPLMHSVRDCQIHLPLVQFLIEAGADADAENAGYRVIDYAEGADAPEKERAEALEMIWKAPRPNRGDLKKRNTPRQ